MKPVNLNQLLFHPKLDSLSFFQSPESPQMSGAPFDVFYSELHSQLTLENKLSLATLLEKNRNAIKKILGSHPGKSHGFFMSEELQGYIILDQKVDSYSMIGQTFHVRPILEEIFGNPEFMLVNISLYDVKVYRGDFQYIEIIDQYEFDELPKNFSDSPSRLFASQYLGLVPHKTISALKTIAYKIKDLTLYHSMPVVVTGLEEIKHIFLRYFEDSTGIISQFQEDFYEKTCVEILERSKIFHHAVMDHYSFQLKERLKRMMKYKLLLTELSDVIKATYAGKIVHLVLPAEQKLWGKIDPETGEFIIHKKTGKNSIDILNELAEEVIKQGGKIQILGTHFFPQDAKVLAVLKG